MEELLFQYNPWWEDSFNYEKIIERNSYLKFLEEQLKTRNIVFLTGLRRVGKTTLMKTLIKKLLERGIKKENILYVSLDDYLLNRHSIYDVLEEYKKIHKLKSDEYLYLFLDEIVSKEDYHQQLKNFYDKGNIKIFASASSSSLLRDRKAMLTGRTLTLEVKPLDFEEYKLFKKIKLSKKDLTLSESYFKDYIREGGLPENVLNPSREYLNELVDNIIQKDITAFYGLKDHNLLKDYFVLLMERSGKQISINKIANILSISPDTARRYLSYFEETFLIHLVPRWGKTNTKILSPKKLYATDLGIKYLFTGKRDLGSYFENYIYLKLKKRHRSIFYLYKEGVEIDFYTSDGILLESKYNSILNPKQKKLFDEFTAKKKMLIDSVKSLALLEEI